jgi:phosphomannomutase
MVVMLSLLSRRQTSIDGLVAPFMRYSATGEVNFKVRDANLVLSELKRRYQDGEVDELDGVTVQYQDWWFNVRKSNTEPLVRLNLEADIASLRDAKLAELVPLLGHQE